MPDDDAAAPVQAPDAGGDPAVDTPPTPRSARFAWAAMFLILVGVVVLLVVALTGNPSSPQVVRRTAVPQSVMDDLKVPSSAFAAAAASTTASSVTFTPPSVVTATPTLTSDGHPWVVYVGAEYCAFCAAERWPLIVALSRFGTFTRLSSMQSTPASVFPAIQGFTFVGSSYTSPYLSFSGIEEFSNVPSSDGSYSRLAVPPVGVRILQARYTGSAPMPPDAGGSTGTATLPFVDVADRLVSTTSGFSPALLAKSTQSSLAASLSQPTTPAAVAVLVSATQLTAGICTATGGQPASVCATVPVQRAAARLLLG